MNGDGPPPPPVELALPPPNPPPTRREAGSPPHALVPPLPVKLRTGVGTAKRGAAWLPLNERDTTAGSLFEAIFAAELSRACLQMIPPRLWQQHAHVVPPPRLTW